MKTICQTIQHQQRMVWNIRFGLSQCNWNCTLPRTKSGTSVDWSLSSASRARIRLPRKPSLAPFTSSGLEISRWKWQSFVWALYCKTYIQVVAVHIHHILYILHYILYIIYYISYIIYFSSYYKWFFEIWRFFGSPFLGDFCTSDESYTPLNT